MKNLVGSHNLPQTEKIWSGHMI